MSNNLPEPTAWELLIFLVAGIIAIVSGAFRRGRDE